MDYQYRKGYQTDSDLMKSYFEFTESVFRFSLADWKQAGKWDEKYVPHSLVADGRVIANASASIMELQILGKTIPAVQLGSVGVLSEYRGSGLSRVIMEKILEEYRHIPVIFLFANHKVLDFYPKFGFRRVDEIIPQIYVPQAVAQTGEAVKIDLESADLNRLLKAKLQHSAVVDARGNSQVYWYHLMYNYRDRLYYIKERDVVLIAKYQDDCVVISDILSAAPVTLDELAGYIIKPGINRVRFDFTPDWLVQDYDTIPNEGEVMYVYGDFPQDIDFKFPVTAHT